MATPIDVPLEELVTQVWGSPVPNEVFLSVLLGVLTSIVALGLRYRYSTELAVFYLAVLALMGVSPLSTTVFGVRPRYFFGGLFGVQAVGVLAVYLYSVKTGKPTGVDAFRTTASKWFDRLRDRRRRIRRQLEAILDRKTVIAVLVGMPLSEFVKETIVRVMAADPINWRLAWAHFALMLLGLAVGVHWERIKVAASDAGDQAEALLAEESD